MSRLQSSNMSHTVTITRTTTTSTGSPLFINSNYLCTTPGFLKLAQLLLGAACVGVVGYYWDHGYLMKGQQTPVLFFFLVSVACLVGTFCLVAACVASLSTSSLLSKTLYEVIYHGVAFILYLSAGLTLIIEVSNQRRDYNSKENNAYLAASIMGLVLAGLYLLSTFFANRTYRGI